MKGIIATVLVLCIVASVSAVQMGTAPSCISSNSCVTRDWIKGDAAPQDEMLRIVFALQLQNTDALEKILLEVSDPKSPKYGEFLTHEQVGELTSSKLASVAVNTWLTLNGVVDIEVTSNKDFLIAYMPVKTAEKLFSTKFFHFTSETQEKTITRCLAYSLPDLVAPHVEFVGYTIQFPALRHHFAYVETKQKGPNASGNTDPSLINTNYGITSNKVASDKATQSLYESLGQSYSPSDLTSFQSQFNIPKQAIANVIGKNNPNGCNVNPNNCVEANLDVQYIMAVAQGSPTTYWSVPNSGDIFLEWIVALANTTNPPLVHSMSYGSIESEEDPNNMNRFSTLAQQLGTKGVTLVIASGDDGVANFVARSDPSQCGFNPSFPATVPYVTAVGATQGPEFGKPEVMCSSKTAGLITSGGGFSGVFSQPSYQSTVVASYLKNGPNLPPTSQFKSTGRAYPDVAALGHNYEVVIAGQTYQVSGTSASAPVFAGIISLINGMRLAKGKSSLGFLNTALYSLDSSVWNDITSGTNNCCAGNDPNIVCCTYGFTASSGWDPTTGFGSPKFQAFSSAFLNA